MTLPPGVAYRVIEGRESLATRGSPVSGEPSDGTWRAWRPERSKVAAMIDAGLDVGLEAGMRVLYLGAASGTTVSHLADVTGPVYAVEFAARPMRELVSVAEPRENVIPLLKDARRPSTYGHIVEADIDLLVQDVATRGQAAVAIANRRFLAPDGRLVLAIKARSEDVTAAPREVFDAAVAELGETYEIRETARLDPLHGDHLAIIATPHR